MTDHVPKVGDVIGWRPSRGSSLYGTLSRVGDLSVTVRPESRAGDDDEPRALVLRRRSTDSRWPFHVEGADATKLRHWLAQQPPSGVVSASWYVHDQRLSVNFGRLVTPEDIAAAIIELTLLQGWLRRRPT